MNNRRALPLLAITFLLACPTTQGCGGPRLTTLAPGVYGDAGEAGSAGTGQTGDGASLEAGAAGASAAPDAGAGGTVADSGAHG